MPLPSRRSSLNDPGGIIGCVGLVSSTVSKQSNQGRYVVTWQISQLLAVQTITPHWACDDAGVHKRQLLPKNAMIKSRTATQYHLLSHSDDAKPRRDRKQEAQLSLTTRPKLLHAVVSCYYVMRW